VSLDNVGQTPEENLKETTGHRLRYGRGSVSYVKQGATFRTATVRESVPV
jgi:hypothetical protein